MVIFVGIGSTISPLVCQALIASGVPWPNFYFGSLVISATNLCIVSVCFKPTSREMAQERARIWGQEVKGSSLTRETTSSQMNEKSEATKSEDDINLPSKGTS